MCTVLMFNVAVNDKMTENKKTTKKMYITKVYIIHHFQNSKKMKDIVAILDHN